jgi:tetratricopeptide (TPR) repeat protein
MSFIHGRTLKDTVEDYHAGRSTGAEPREVQFVRLLEIFVKVCQAVAYAHHRGVVHRDLKPDNVMLGPFGEALVLDWGMAKVCSQPEAAPGASPVQVTYSSGSVETQDGLVMGSPAYMPPEVAAGRAADADGRTDVYLLGATLFHILTGQPPRQGRSREEIVELARTVPTPSPRRLRADVPRALEAICLKATAHRKEDRYGGARELAQDMERYLAGAPVSAYREPLLVRIGRWCKRHRRALGRSLAVAAGLAAALVGAALVRGAWEREEATRRLAEEEVRQAREHEDAAKRRADEAQRRDEVRRGLKQFDRLADERRFHAVSTTPAGESAPFYDSRRGQAAGQQAIDLARDLLAKMRDLPPPAERATLDSELHDLLLLMAQVQGGPSPDPKVVPDVLDRLERAAVLRGPSHSYHRLRASCYRARGEAQQAAEEARLATAAPLTALDHFLQAEEYRVRAGSPGETSADGLAWQPNRELLRQAVAHYQEALRIEPENFWCHLQLGRCYLSLGQGPEAVEALGTCVALRPKEPWGYSARGLTLGLVGRYAEGEADLERALQIDAEFLPALLNRGILAWLQKKPEPALADFTRVLESPADRRLIEAAYYRGQLHLQRREDAKALQDFDLVWKENPSFRPVYLSRAQALFLHGDETRALADLTTFLDQGRPTPYDPKDPKLFAQRGRLLCQLVPRWGLPRAEEQAALGRTQGELERARRLGYGSAELFDDLGSVAQRLGKWDEARAAYEQALRAAPPPGLAVRVRTKRGWIDAAFLAPPQYDRARDDFAEALRLDPAHADAHAGLGYVRARQNSPSEAQHEAAQALWHEGENYLILHNVACIYAVLSQVEPGQAKQHQGMAMDLLRRAVDLSRRAGEGPSEIEAIRGDPALDVLRGLPDYGQLLQGQAGQ